MCIRDRTYPVFVKPARGGSSLGIVRVESPEGLAAAIEEARRFDPKVVVEQGFVGMREIELGVIENPTGPPRVSLPGEILMHTPDAFYDFDAKYLPEEQVSLEVPAEVDEDLRAAVQELAARTFSAMAVEGLARVDPVSYTHLDVYKRQIDDYTRQRLLEGLDDIALTLTHEADIAAFEANRPSWLPRTQPAKTAG